jgi:hypothetical protein
MRTARTVTALLAAGLLAASLPAAAQDAPAETPASPAPAGENRLPMVPPPLITGINQAPTLPLPPTAGADEIDSTSGGELFLDVLGREDVPSAKFEEYREVPEGVSIPFFRLFSRTDEADFTLFGYDALQDDQRYTGWLDAAGLGLFFDYNQIPHNMGNDGRTIHTETGAGVWEMSDTTQRALGAVVDATPTRTTPFYDALLAPSFASAGRVDVSSSRNRGTVAFDASRKLPFDVVFTYMREHKSGYRAEDGGPLFSAVSPVIEVPSPLDEITQDFGIRLAKNFSRGNVHAGFSRNLYSNRAETLVIDNPFQYADVPFVASPTPAVGGGSRGRLILPPDNEASTGNVGFALKFGRQTRVGGDLSLARWTQNAPFHPYTINTAILTPDGRRADALSTLQQPSLDGRIDTTTLNLTFFSRPIEHLAVRASYRLYDLTNETERFVITGDVSEVPDRDWTVVTPTPDAPYGHATANPYDTKTRRFTASAAYDIGDLTLEVQGRTASLERTSREATSGDETGFALAAVYHASDWLAFRGSYDQSKRTAEGETIYGFQADEAEREMKRTGILVDFSLPKGFDVGLSYFRRDVDYPNRPDRIPVSSGVPTAGGQPFPGTPSGLLLAKYDSFGIDVGYAPSERVAISAFYTYEKNRSTNQWSTTSGLALNNLLNYAASDETDTFGLNAVFALKPEVWKLTLNGSRQKVDGLADITAREAGSFYTPGRTTLIPPGAGGAQDIADWDDSELTMFSAQLDYAIAKAWTLAAGYAYEKYDFKDAYTVGDLLLPQALLFVLKSNDGPYNVNLLYARIGYRF